MCRAVADRAVRAKQQCEWHFAFHLGRYRLLCQFGDAGAAQQQPVRQRAHQLGQLYLLWIPGRHVSMVYLGFGAYTEPQELLFLQTLKFACLHPWPLCKLVTGLGLMLNCETQELSSWKSLSLCIHGRHVSFLLVLWSGFCKTPSSLRCNAHAHAHAESVVCETVMCRMLCRTVLFVNCISRSVTIVDVMQLMIWVETPQEFANIVMGGPYASPLQNLPTPVMCRPIS